MGQIKFKCTFILSKEPNIVHEIDQIEHKTTQWVPNKFNQIWLLHSVVKTDKIKVEGKSSHILYKNWQYSPMLSNHYERSNSSVTVNTGY